MTPPQPQQQRQRPCYMCETPGIVNRYKMPGGRSVWLCSKCMTKLRTVGDTKKLRRTQSKKSATSMFELSTYGKVRLLFLIIAVIFILIGVGLGDHSLIPENANYDWARRLGY